nr:DNA dependent RNA polymerase beta subunit [Megalocytivirus FD201807]
MSPCHTATMQAHLSYWTTPQRLVHHHIAHYEHLLKVQIPQVVEGEPPVIIHNHSVTFGDVAYSKPSPETPGHARAYDETYETTVSCKAYLTCLATGAKHVQHIHNLAKMPVMVRAQPLCQGIGECEKDPGGFFIVKGKERIIIPHIHTAYNIPITMHCTTKKTLVCEMRTHNETTGNNLLVKVRLMQGCIIEMSVPYIKSFLPAGAVFNALGVSEEDMLRYCNLAWQRTAQGGYVSDHIAMVQYMLMQYRECQPNPFEYIAKIVAQPTVTTEYVRSVLAGVMFCHTSPEMSGQHLGYMVATLLNAHVVGAVHDKDNLRWKRVDTSGALILFLFRNLFKQWVCTVKRVMEKSCVVGVPDLQGKSGSVNAITNVITNVLHLAFATGNWLVRKNSGTSKNTYTPRGVSQLMCVQNYGARISNLRRMTHAVGFKGKNIKVRQLHNSHNGYICPYETPEGDRVGNVVQLALSATVTVPVCPRNIRTLMMSVLRLFADPQGNQPVLLNGEIVAWVRDRMLCGMAMMHVLWDYPNVTVVFRHGYGVHVYSEGGRLVRPLIHRGQYRMVCPSLVQELLVRPFPSPTERVVSMDSMRAEFMDLPGIVVLTDAMSAVIPFYNHTQSPRNAYQSNMGKQAVGLPCLNYMSRWDVTLDVLMYPQVPLSRSKAMDALSFDTMPHGACPIVAVLTFDGYNQEDSIILNRSSVQRGMFVSTTYKTLCECEKHVKRCEFERIMCVPVDKRRPGLVYDYLGDDGIFDPALARGMFVTTGVVVVGKMSFDQSRPEGVCCSLAVKPHEEGYFDDKLVFNMADGCKCVKIKLRKIRIPEMGDKFASFTAQKGTCGMMYDQWDMPFTADGVVPDLVINPHAFPSRMTVHYLLQMCFELGAVAGGGKGYDATAFNSDGADLLKTLEELGYAKQVMYCGRTGRRFESLVFMAPCPYQKLKHLVANKVHARTTGPVDPLTRQPVAGRSRDGGIKIGEMEQWCKISHGAAAALHESMTTMSDPYTVPVCSVCHVMTDSYEVCRHCRSVSVQSYAMPYTSKLFFQQLASIGIKTRIMD